MAQVGRDELGGRLHVAEGGRDDQHPHHRVARDDHTLGRPHQGVGDHGIPQPFAHGPARAHGQGEADEHDGGEDPPLVGREGGDGARRGDPRPHGRAALHGAQHGEHRHEHGEGRGPELEGEAPPLRRPQGQRRDREEGEDGHAQPPPGQDRAQHVPQDDQADGLEGDDDSGGRGPAERRDVGHPLGDHAPIPVRIRRCSRRQWVRWMGVR